MQSTRETLKQRYNTLKTQMNHYDPDFAEMAAKELCDLILSDSIDLKAPQNKEMGKSITTQYLKQVGSDNFEVHSRAIRCLAEIVPKMNKQQLLDVFKTTISSIADPKTQTKRKQVFTSSAGEMIERAPIDIGNNLATLYVQCVIQFLNLSSRKNTKDEEEVLLHLLTIIINFSSKWPDVIGSKQLVYDREKLIYVMLRYVQTSPKIDLVLKCMTALQKISNIFDAKHFQFAFNSKQVGLLNFILKNESFTRNQEQLRNLKKGIVCLDHIVHAHNREMKSWAHQIAEMCVKIVNNYKNVQIDADADRDIVVTITEIIQSSIDCLTSLLKAYSFQLGSWLGNGKFQFLSSFVQQTLNFDLERMMSYLHISQQSEYEYEEEDYYYTEDSICWKVRQVTLAYITMLMKRDNDFKNQQVKQPNFMNLLSMKIIQENQNVNKKAFECFNYIIQSISTTKVAEDTQENLVIRRVKTTDRNFALDLVQTISDKISILFAHKKTKQQTKNEASKTLLNIIQLLHEQIKDNETICAKILALIQDLLPKVKPDSCINLIKSTKSLLNGHFPYNKTVAMIDVYIKMTKSNNFKIVAASFDGIRGVIKFYHEELIASKKIDQILAVVVPKLKEHDADKLIKIQVTRCLGATFAHVLSRLPAKTQTQILQAAEVKLKVQIDKTIILSQIPQIPYNFVLQNDQKVIFKNMLQMCCESIGSANYDINSLSMQCCQKLIRLLGKDVNEKSIDILLNKSRAMIMDGKIPKYLNLIIESFPNSIKPFAQIIVKTGESDINLKMIQKKIISASQCVEILKHIVTPENTKKLSLFFSKINNQPKSLIAEINDSKWGLVSLGSLGYVGNLKTIQDINKMIATSKSHDFKFEGARAIGNIASRYPQYSLKLIELSKQANQGYLYLHALKEMLSFTTKQFPQLQTIIHFIFLKSQQSDKETNKHLLAQCIGYISKISPAQLQKILKSIPQMNSARKYVVASSLRYALENRGEQSMEDEIIEEFISIVANLTMDKDVNVREGAMKSLNSIAGNHLDKVKSNINNQFVTNLLDSMSIKAQLIKTIDYGFSKQKKDLGKGLRIESFNFLRSILNFRQIQNFYDAIISKCLDKINEETSNDLILKRVHIIRVICQKDNTLLTPFQNQFATKIGVTQGVLKPYAANANSEDQRSQGYLKGLLKQIIIISRLSKEGSEQIKAMINKIKTLERLAKVVEALQKL